MPEAFILILMLAGYGRDNPAAVAVATFQDEAACRTAGDAAKKASPLPHNTTYVCVPDKTPPPQPKPQS